MHGIKIVQIVTWKDGFIGIDSEGKFYRGIYREGTKSINGGPHKAYRDLEWHEIKSILHI